MKILTILALALLPFSALADSDAGFETGNDFQSVYIEGEISVNCQDGMNNDFASFRCAAELLDPAEYVKFKGPIGVDADEVVLKATREDGSTREKNESYDPVAGLSKGRFNLWISTLFQRPLLKLGKNEIEYSLTKDGKVTKSGNFTANVSQGEDRSCRYRRHYFSSDINDCRSSQRLCSRYFHEENYCQ
jgi:hypothetical protein